MVRTRSTATTVVASTAANSQSTPNLRGTTVSGNAGAGSARAAPRSAAGSLAAGGRAGLGGNRCSPMLGAPTAASKGWVTVWANARLRAAAQSRQIFAPGGQSRPQILQLIGSPLVPEATGQVLDSSADRYDNVIAAQRGKHGVLRFGPDSSKRCAAPTC